MGGATYHQCYITYSNSVTNTRTAVLDTTSNSVFREWTLRASNELEDIDNSHILLNCLLDVLVNKYDRNTYYSFFGAESCFGTTRTAFNARDGYMFIVAETQYFNQLVVSGIIGMNQSKLLPLSEYQQGIQLDIQCETTTYALVGAATCSYSISNRELHLA